MSSRHDTYLSTGITLLLPLLLPLLVPAPPYLAPINYMVGLSQTFHCTKNRTSWQMITKLYRWFPRNKTYTNQRQSGFVDGV